MPRSPEYVRADVLASAQRVFWRRGYARTSVADLVAATGLKPGSLYAAFGSKKGLFLEVLDSYNHDFIERINRLRHHESGALAGLAAVLDRIVDNAVTGADRRGCLAVNALLETAQHDSEIDARLRRHNARTLEAFATLVTRAQAQGDVPADRDPADVAVFLVNSIWGLRVMCRADNDRHRLNAVTAGILAGVSQPQAKARFRLSPAR